MQKLCDWIRSDCHIETSQRERFGRVLFEEVARRCTQHFGDPLQPAGADTVHALLVLLHLLESHTYLLGKPFLTEPEQLAAHSHPRTYIGINCVRRLCIHLTFSMSWN